MGLLLGHGGDAAHAPAIYSRVILLIAAPVLIILIGLQVGWLYSLLALAAFVSMFRNPLRFLLAKLRGQNPEVPK